MTQHWVDAHLDLAYLALTGRDMAGPLEGAAGGHPPAAVTIPSLIQGNVRCALGTIFTEVGAPKSAFGYKDFDDRDGAHRAGLVQLEQYENWEARGLIRIVRAAGDLPATPAAGTDRGPLHVVLLMEGADPIRRPDEAAWWFARGVRAVGIAWARGTRYASGNEAAAGAKGLTDEGRALVKAFNALGIIHDLTHLNDQAADDLLAMTDRPVIATHSACRSLMDGKRQRHISDELVCQVGRRGGVVGLPLFSKFLSTTPGRASLEQTAAHVEHMAKLMGRRDGVGLGSDMDGGFSAEELPVGIERPEHLSKLAATLAGRGWSADEVDGFGQGNWVGFLGRELPKERA